jgi:virulence factor
MGRHHARIWSILPGSEFVGIADPDTDRAREIANRYDVPVYADFNELLTAVDAVSIAAPTTLHHQIGSDCIKQGVHLLVEKPLAATLSEAESLVTEAEEAGVTLQVGHIERFNPTFIELVNVLKNREILALDAKRLSPFTTRAADVSVVYDLMIHDLDLVLTLVGEKPTGVRAAGRNARSPRLDYVTAFLDFACGPVASLAASKVTQHKVRQLTATCDDSFVVADFLGRTVMVFREAAADYFAQKSEVLYRQEEIIEQVYVPPVEPLYAQLQHFLACIQNKREPDVGGKDGLQVMTLADSIESQALDSIRYH